MRGTREHRTVPKLWTDWETEQLCDMIADGWTFGGAARKLNRTRNSCIGRWHNHVIPAVGGQAR